MMTNTFYQVLVFNGMDKAWYESNFNLTYAKAIEWIKFDTESEFLTEQTYDDGSKLIIVKDSCYPQLTDVFRLIPLTEQDYVTHDTWKKECKRLKKKYGQHSKQYLDLKFKAW